MPFLTPELPARTIPITLEVPDTLLPYVVGALSDLCFEHHWELFGSMTPVEARDYGNAILDSLLEDNISAILPAGGTAGQTLVLVDPLTGELGWSDYHYTPPAEVKLLYEASLDRPYTLYPNPGLQTAYVINPLTSSVQYPIGSTKYSAVNWANNGEAPCVIFEFSGPVRIWRAMVWGTADNSIPGDPYYPPGAGIFWSDDGINWTGGTGADHISHYTPDLSYTAEIWCYQEVTPHQYWYVAVYDTRGVGITTINRVQLMAVSEV